MSDELNIPVPLTRGDLIVLAWYAAWTPEVHKAAWRRRRAWPPGFREMADLSCPDRNSIANAEEEMKDGPLLKGDTPHKRVGARRVLRKLLEYRLVEGNQWNACRLTTRGRAALKVHDEDCPAYFKSHCPKIFDDHSLLPVNGHNVRLDTMDKVMGRLDGEHQVAYGEALPDTKATWSLMLREYSEDDYRGSGTLTGASAGLRISSTTGRHLNGSLRSHHQYVTLTVNDPDEHRVLEAALSLEGLADLLTSSSDVPITIDQFRGRDGMLYSRPVPPPVSISRRVQERVARGNQDLQRWIRKAIDEVGDTRMGKRASAEITRLLELALRDADAHGSFAAQQAMEEVSAVAESMMTVMGERMQLAGQGSAGLLVGGEEPSTALMLEGPVLDADGEESD